MDIEEKLIPPQTDWVLGVAETVGFGSTVTVTVFTDEEQLSASEVIVNVVVWGILVKLVKFPIIKEPVPFEAIPVRFILLSLVQEKFVPLTLFGFKKSIWVMLFSEQTVWFRGVALTEGMGFTSILTVNESEMQPSSEIETIVKWCSKICGS